MFLSTRIDKKLRLRFIDCDMPSGIRAGPQETLETETCLYECQSQFDLF